MNTSETVMRLAKEGMKASEIAKMIGVSRQRVYQILSKQDKPKDGSRRSMNKSGLEQAKKVLKRRSSWTWVEADEELTKSGIRVPGMKIYDLLRELGFTKRARNQSTWYKEAN